MDSTGRRVTVGQALTPMWATGFLVGMAASPDQWWTLWGAGVGLLVWVGWALVLAGTHAAIATRRQQR